MQQLPAELTALTNWVCWRWMIDDETDPKGKRKTRVPPMTRGATKVPFQINGKYAKSTDPATWTSYAKAMQAASGAAFDGVGICFADHGGMFGVDLDHCIVDGVAIPAAQAIIDALASYAEISPSGTGVKIFCAGDVVTALQATIDAAHDATIEVYGWGRFFTVTGNHYPGTPLTIENAEAAIALIRHQYKPAPPSAPQRPVQRARTDDTHLQQWADTVLERARQMVLASSNGNRHNTRVAAAKLAGGLIPHGLTSESDILAILYDAGPPVANHRQEMQAIQAGIVYGAAQPLDAPEPPPMPAFDRGWAVCPEHGKILQPSRNGNGWRCGTRDSSSASGWCSFWWQGAGYTPPKTVADVPPMPTTARPITIMHASELQWLPQTTWLIKDELPTQSIIMLYGPSGTGKSFVTVDYALRIGQTHTVLYIAAEGAAGYHKRIEAWCDHHRLGKANTYFVPHAVNFMEPAWVDSLISAAQSLRPDLVIIDTMARSSEGADENSSRDMGMFHAACDRVKTALSCSVLYVHHTGKTGSKYRGSSALQGAADVQIALSNTDGAVSLKWEKNKDEVSGYTRRIKLINALTSLVAVDADTVSGLYDDALTDMQRQILIFMSGAIFETHGAAQSQIKEGCEIESMGGLYAALNKLKERGFITQRKQRDPYFISDSGRRAISSEPPSTYAEPDGYMIEDTADDHTILQEIKRLVEAHKFDEAQSKAAAVMSTHRQAAAFTRIAQLRAAAGLQTEFTTAPDTAPEVDATAVATTLIDTALGLLSDESVNPDPATIHNTIADYEDIVWRNGLTALYHQRKSDLDTINTWLDQHFDSEAYYVE